jgi:hypothetical protein
MRRNYIFPKAFWKRYSQAIGSFAVISGIGGLPKTSASRRPRLRETDPEQSSVCVCRFGMDFGRCGFDAGRCSVATMDASELPVTREAPD